MTMPTSPLRWINIVRIKQSAYWPTLIQGPDLRIGIIGAGQLGQMLSIAAKDLGIECRLIEADDMDALSGLAGDCDVVSYEFENVPVDALLTIADKVQVYPPPDALRIAQDRLNEKRLFEDVQIPLPAYRRIDSLVDLQVAISDLGLPVVLKTRRFGYDGKGQIVIREPADAELAWTKLGKQPLIAEAWVPFDYEVSVIGARNPGGDIVTWSLTRNEHVDGILRTSRSLVDSQPMIEQALPFIVRLLQHLDYVGVLALELFVVGDELLANEFAPRVHNSGHWTIEGAETSQFTNHMLAISGQELQDTNCPRHAGMINLIGTIPEAASAIQDPRVSLHDYGKTPRPGRKLGHITVVADSASERDDLLRKIGETVT
jgi:5-(carboxyamino)imidazole ribonucleotide synthase